MSSPTLKRQKTEEQGGERSPPAPLTATLNNILNESLRHIASYLPSISRATFATAVMVGSTEATLSRIAEQGTMITLGAQTKASAIMGGDTETGALVETEWETLDFSEDLELASKIDDVGIAAVLCLAGAHLKHLKLPLMGGRATGRGMAVLGHSTVLETISMDPLRWYKRPDNRFMKDEVFNMVDTLLDVNENSFRRLHSPGPNCADKFAHLLRNRVGVMNLHSGCVYFGVTYDDLDETRFDDLDKCYSCHEVAVNRCYNCEKRMRCINGKCCEGRDIAICQGSSPWERSCTKFLCEECKDRDDVSRGKKVFECNQVEQSGGRHCLCLGCMQRRCRMHVDADYGQRQAQLGVDPGPECRHCIAYVLRDMFITLNL
jgi:hypothetical protein